MTMVERIVNFFIQRRLPPGFEHTESMEQALESARQRYQAIKDEAESLMQDVIKVGKEQEKHDGNGNSSK